ncbi:MAG: hypothetical protein C5S44_11175 [Candidatus Methanocomedens sp.]|nr:MAG: hypothetical protein C5S44_11175 [ANME-2 cluster archaeon]
MQQWRLWACCCGRVWPGGGGDGGGFLNFSDALCGCDLAHSSPHPYFGSPAAFGREVFNDTGT